MGGCVSVLLLCATIVGVSFLESRLVSPAVKFFISNRLS